MALHYIQPYHVAGMAVYRCSCGEKVIMKTQKVTSGERTGCRKCDSDEQDSISQKFGKGSQFGCITLTGVSAPMRSSQNRVVKGYEGKCICGKVEMYKTYQLNDMPDTCIHLYPRYRQLQVGQMLGVHIVLEKLPSIRPSSDPGIRYHLRCTVCNREFTTTRNGLKNPHKCNCSWRYKKETVKIGATYGIYQILARVPANETPKSTLYEARCTVCGTIVRQRSSNYTKDVKQCRHQTTPKKEAE